MGNTTGHFWKKCEDCLVPSCSWVASTIWYVSLFGTSVRLPLTVHFMRYTCLNCIVATNCESDNIVAGIKACSLGEDHLLKVNASVGMKKNGDFFHTRKILWECDCACTDCWDDFGENLIIVVKNNTTIIGTDCLLFICLSLPGGLAIFQYQRYFKGKELCNSGPQESDVLYVFGLLHLSRSASGREEDLWVGCSWVMTWWSRRWMHEFWLIGLL